MFQPHGTFQVTSDGPILISEFVGPWNCELGLAWMQAIDPVAKMLAAKGPFTSLTVVRNSALTSPETLILMRKSIVVGKQMGLVADAHVIAKEVEGAYLADRMFAPVFQGLIPHACFELKEEAKSWLLTQLDASSIGRSAAA